MIIDHPAPEQIPQLRALWKQAFGDGDAFLDIFFSTAFSPARCRVLTENGRICAALYWFDCTCRGGKLAYLYAVATEESCRGRGLCRTLMDSTHADLKQAGYAGTILVPGEPELFAMYGKMGYRVCSHIREIACHAAEIGAALRPVTVGEYAGLRRNYLPEDGVVQEGENLEFLDKLGQFYTGAGFCLWAAVHGDTATGELLGDPSRASAIVRALGANRGIFRTPGAGRPFAMYRPLSHFPEPNYLGFAFD